MRTAVSAISLAMPPRPEPVRSHFLRAWRSRRSWLRNAASKFVHRDGAAVCDVVFQAGRCRKPRKPFLASCRISAVRRWLRWWWFAHRGVIVVADAVLFEKPDKVLVALPVAISDVFGEFSYQRHRSSQPGVLAPAIPRETKLRVQRATASPFHFAARTLHRPALRQASVELGRAQWKNLRPVELT